MKTRKILALLLSVAMILGLVAGCGSKQEEPAPADPTPAANTEPAPVEEPKTLVVGYSPFNSKFSPFFSETAYDQDVYAMTALSLLPSDRTGAVITKGIEGETVNYNGTDYTYYGPADLEMTENADGTVFYDFPLRDDLVFSDGEPLSKAVTDHYVKSHDNIKDKLSDLTQIIYKYIPGERLNEEMMELVFDIMQLSRDLEKHAMIEELLLMPPEDYDLSDREQEVLVLVAQGLSSKEIAAKLNIAVNTVNTHRKSITKKTGIKSVAGLAVYAMLKNN